MNRTVCMAVAIACATTVAAAQTPNTTAGADDKTVTLTGCLQDGSAAAGSSATKSGYILANAMAGPSSMSSSRTGTTAATTAGTTGTTGTTARGVSYALDGHDSELKSHVGHRIEVVGTLEHKMPPASATATTTAGSAARAMEDQKLKVSSVRMIAAECSVQ